jgi:hypothetical protein
VEDVSYKGFTIELMSLRLPEQLWLPRAILYYERGGSLNTYPTLSAPADVTFPTKEEADQYAIALAKSWIDREQAAD